MSVPRWHRSSVFQTVEASQLEQDSSAWSEALWLAEGHRAETECPGGREQTPGIDNCVTGYTSTSFLSQSNQDVAPGKQKSSLYVALLGENALEL